MRQCAGFFFSSATKNNNNSIYTSNRRGLSDVLYGIVIYTDKLIQLFEFLAAQQIAQGGWETAEGGSIWNMSPIKPAP
jgi:hypothetical protein